jgi:hypothetical protein
VYAGLNDNLAMCVMLTHQQRGMTLAVAFVYQAQVQQLLPACCITVARQLHTTTDTTKQHCRQAVRQVDRHAVLWLNPGAHVCGCG